MRAAIAIAFFCAASGAIAQDFPARPLRFIVPSAPGATTDVLARITAQKVAEQFGRQLIIDNRPGAGSVIGTDIVAKAPADGYTIGMIYTTHTANASLQKLPYDPIGDFAHVTMLTSAPLLLIVAPSLGVNSVRELIALAKTKPLNYGSAGVGSGGHMSGELFRMMAGISTTHIPHRGAAPASIDVAAGNLAFQFASQITVQALLKGGRLRALAVTSAQRIALLPELPTAAELGYAGYQCGNWYGFMLPAKTPRDIVMALHKATLVALANAEIKRRLDELGYQIVGDQPEAFAAFIKSEIDDLARLVKSLNLKADAQD